MKTHGSVLLFLSLLCILSSCRIGKNKLVFNESKEIELVRQSIDNVIGWAVTNNRRAYFQTGKVVDGQLLMYTMFAERTDKGWSEVKDPGEPFNPGKTMHISGTLDGKIYTTDISRGMGTESLGRIIKVNGEYKILEKLGPPFNTVEKQQHPWIAPDESYIIFTVRIPGQNPVSVLFCSFRNKDGKWSEPVELKLSMDAGQPYVTFDGKYLFITSGDPRTGSDIYWVSAKIIEELRPKE